MRLVILTGMSGAGKSTGLKFMEDIGFYCIDNIPIPLIEKVAEFAREEATEISKIALGIDIRNAENIENLQEVVEKLKLRSIPCEVVYFDADDETLIKRYKETRRSHPLAVGERVENGLYIERDKLISTRENADYIIDTSKLLVRELKAELEKIFQQNQDFRNLFVNIVSFGFKYGIPVDSDLVFDVRFLPNPYYVEELKILTGNDEQIRDFVFKYDEAKEFIDKLEDMIRFLIPHYIDEGKNQLVISIGCTGGKHRSVVLANELMNRLANNGKYGVKIEHRDIERDSIRR